MGLAELRLQGPIRNWWQLYSPGTRTPPVANTPKVQHLTTGNRQLSLLILKCYKLAAETQDLRDKYLNHDFAITNDPWNAI